MLGQLPLHSPPLSIQFDTESDGANRRYPWSGLSGLYPCAVGSLVTTVLGDLSSLIVPCDSQPTALPVVPFDWTQTSSWEALPVQSATLILTIPPIRDLEANRNHLQQWSAWMREHRPTCSRLLYVSTTGIYPKQAGVWTEDTGEEPDSLSGELRKQTEDLLGEAFDLQVVRPGGIYGPKRNLWQRLRNGQAMPTSPHQPTHRIHVEDLARLIHLLILKPELPSCINAVDHQPLPSLRVAQWCAKQRPTALQLENHGLLG